MEITKILSDLRSERDRIDRAILALERLAIAAPERRGRPPKSIIGGRRRRSTDEAAVESFKAE